MNNLMAPFIRSHKILWIQGWALALLVLAVSSTAIGQDQSDKISRSIFVPFDEVNVLLEGNSDRVLLTRKEYDKLLADAQTRTIKKAPQDAVVISAKYVGTVGNGIAEIVGTLVIESLNDGLVQVPLSINGVSIRSAMLADSPANLWRDKQGQIQLLVSGKKRQTLTLKLTVPMQTTAARQMMSLELPAPSATQFQLTVPGNVEVKSGLSVIKRSYSDSENSTQFELLPVSGSMSLVMSLNNRLLKDDRVVVAHNVSIHKLSPTTHELHVTASLDIIHGAVEKLQFAIPDGYAIHTVITELMNQWEIQSDEDGKNRLMISLRVPTRDDIIVNIVASRSASDAVSWESPQLRPLNVAGSISVIGVLADTQLSVEKVEAGGATPIDHEFLSQAIPQTVTSHAFANPVSIVAAYYAPQTDYQIKSVFSQAAPQLHVTSNSRMFIGDKHLEIKGGLSLSSLFDSRFDVDLSLPTGWRFTEVSRQDGAEIPFERFSDENQSRIKCRLGKRITNDQTKIYFTARKTNEKWIESWKSQSINFPVLKISGATKHSGSITVASDSDLVTQPGEVRNLDTRTQGTTNTSREGISQLAFKFKAADYGLTLNVNRLQPVLSARTFSFIEVAPNHMIVRNELVFDIRQAKTDLLKFELPLSTPESISIRGHNCRLKDSSSEIEGNNRVWTVQLANKSIGKIRLLADYQIVLNEQQLQKIEVRALAARDVQFQSTMAVVEGNSELDVLVETRGGRSVDVGEIEEAVYRPGRYLLGAYTWASSQAILTIRGSRRPIYALPNAIIQRAEMITAISAGGHSQTAARFTLATHQPYITVKLPKEAELWSVLLDGKSANPQRNQDSLIVSLASKSENKLRDLQIVYESPSNAIDLVGQFISEAPELGIVDNSGNEFSVPIVDLKWRLVVPKGYAVNGTNQSFYSSDLQPPRLIERLQYWVTTLGGGMNSPLTAVTADFSQSFSPYSNSSTVANGIDAEEKSLGLEARLMAESIPRRGLGRPLDAPASQMAGGILKLESGRASGEKSDAPMEFAGGRAGGNSSPNPMSSVGGAPAPGKKAPVPNLNPGYASGPAASRKAIKKMEMWALKGIGSLDIQLTESGNTIDLLSFGEQPQLVARVSNLGRIKWLAIGIALLISIAGISLTRRTVIQKVIFLGVILLGACLLPLLGDSFNPFYPLADFAILAAILIGIFYLVIAVMTRFSNAIRMIGRSTALVLLACFITFGSANDLSAQSKPTPGDGSHVEISDVDQLRQFISQFSEESKPRIPEDAIVIPFDANDPKGRENANRLLLPYNEYLRLINQQDPGKTGPENSNVVDYVLSSAHYTTELTHDSDLTIRGQLIIDLLTDKPVSIALPIMGGALSSATVDGRPAKLQFQSNRSPQQQAAKQSKRKSSPSHDSSVVMLNLKGTGKKKFEFSVQIKPKRQGGWRSINARLPVGLASSMNITSTQEPLEIRLQSNTDRRAIQTKPGEQIETVLNDDGSIRFQWEPTTATKSIDRSLTVDSEAIFDVREDGLRLAWRFDLNFRGSEIGTFSIQIPMGYIVEMVSGENIRSWDVKPAENWQQLIVSSLSAAKNHETFTVYLSKRDFTATEQPTNLDAPYLSVDGAALQKGIYTIRRSPIIELKKRASLAANRIDENQVQAKIDLAAIDADSSPLGIVPFQSLEFVTTPFKIELQANELEQDVSAETRTILRIGQSEADFEMQIAYDVGKRPIYNFSFDVPKTLAIDDVAVGPTDSWSVEQVDNAQRVNVFLARGMTGTTALLVNGTIKNYDGAKSWSIPKITVNGVDSQIGQFAIQVDPNLRVSIAETKNCEAILVRQLGTWLNAAQRSGTTQGIRYRLGDYSATLKLSKVQPQVSVETITNTRTTFISVEETILLDFNIQRAGIRQIKFLLPEALQNAKIVAQFVSAKSIEKAAPRFPNMVVVQLDLQDDIMGSYRVIIENDRPLQSGDQPVPIPVVLTGETKRRYATLQNVGRDEISVSATSEFTRLNRELSQYADLKRKLAGGELTLAYVAKQNVETPKLSFKTTSRLTVETVSASIEFSKTTMVVDSSGAYRALQNFQVNNRSEQYLDILLPNETQLLTVLVQGFPAKPVQFPKGTDRELRIPLIKTPDGDLDYSVQLKYSGKLGQLKSGQSVQFPVIETTNINVQLSQLHLMLPESHRWFNFGGTMTKVDDKGELEEGYLSYKARQIQQLAEKIGESSGSNYPVKGKSYSKFRALGNLKRLQTEMQQIATESNRSLSREQLSFNERAIRRAQSVAKDQGLFEDNENLARDRQTNQQRDLDNRYRLNDLLTNQSAEIARNKVTRSGKNFQSAQINRPADSKKSKDGLVQQKFDQEWFARNQLYKKEASKASEKQSNVALEHLSKPNEMALRIVKNNRSDGDDTVHFINPNQQRESHGLSRYEPNAESAKSGGNLGLEDDNFQTIDTSSISLVPETRQNANLTPANTAVNSPGLASLDIEIPTRGVSHYFKSPRGSASVIAMPIDDTAYSHWMTAGGILVLCFTIWFSVLFCQSLVKRRNQWQFVGLAFLLLAGISSIVTMTFPVFGILALLLGVAMSTEHIVGYVTAHRANR